MTVTWIVVADRSRAKILELRSLLTGPKIIDDIDNPEGRLTASEINSDRPGQVFDSRGVQRHTSFEADRVTDHLARKFAKRLAGRIEEARKRRGFEQLALICAPALLGLVRDELSKETARLVIHSEAKDLTELPEHTLVSTVQNRVRDALALAV